MIKQLFYILLLTLCIACNNKPKLTMADLKFADYEREWIAKNKVDSMYEITAKRYFGNQYSDTIAYSVFDVNGNRLKLNNTVGWGSRIRNKYDGLGFKKEEIYSTDATSLNYIEYRFIPDSLTLYESYYDTVRNIKEKRIFYTFCYLFNNDGTVKLALATIDDFREPAIVWYKYSKGKIVSIAGYNIRANSEEGFPPERFIKHIYYTEDKPDSAITTFLGPNKNQNFTFKTYYDSLGLKYKKVEYDTIISYYKYTFRK